MKTKLSIREIELLLGDVCGYRNSESQELIQPGLLHIPNLTGQQGLHLQRLATECQKVSKDVEESRKTLIEKFFPADSTDAEKSSPTMFVIDEAKKNVSTQPEGSVATAYCDKSYVEVDGDYWELVGNEYVYRGKLVPNTNLSGFNEAVKSLYEAKIEVEHYAWKESFLDNVVWNKTEGLPSVLGTPIPSVFFKLITLD